MSIQAVKGVEIGAGFEGAVKPGSEVHDAIVRDEAKPRAGGFGRSSNRAGGLEGGVTTGEPLRYNKENLLNPHFIATAAIEGELPLS